MSDTTKQMLENSAKLGYTVDDELLITDCGNEVSARSKRIGPTISQVLASLWQPIETAPIGKRVLLLDGECVSVGILEYSDGGWFGLCGDSFAWNGFDDEWNRIRLHPSMWMPIPPPPKK